LLRHIFLRP